MQRLIPATYADEGFKPLEPVSGLTQRRYDCKVS